MKHKIILVQIILFFGIIANSQPTTVYTCKGGSVAADIRVEFSPQDIANANNYTMSTYSTLGVTFLDNSSNKYNCHAYAWHLREGNTNKVWINNATQQVGNCYPQTHNIDKYWTDGCFLQVCNEADADKLHYFCGDHSAVKSTTNPGFYESKWGAMAVVRHTKTGVPYADPLNSVNYYASAKLSGSNANLCSGTRTFSVKNISGATYLWTYSSTLAIVGLINTHQITVQKNGNATGAAWVSVQITTPCSATPINSRQDFTIAPPATTGSYTVGFVGTPLIVGAVNYVPPSPAIIYFSINNTQAINTNAYTIQKAYGNSFVNVFGSTANFSLANFSNINPADGTLTLLTTANTNCGSVMQAYSFSTKGQCGSCGSLFAIIPNPVSTEFNISPVNNSSQLPANAKNIGTPSIKEIKLIDKMGNVKLTKRYADNLTKTDRINISSLTNDIYTLLIFNGTDWESHKIIKQ